MKEGKGSILCPTWLNKTHLPHPTPCPHESSSRAGQLSLMNIQLSICSSLRSPKTLDYKSGSQKITLQETFKETLEGWQEAWI